MLRAFLFDRSLPLTGGVAHSFLHFGTHRDPAAIAVHALSCQGIDADAGAAFGAAGIAAHDIGDHGYVLPAIALRRLLQLHQPDVMLCCSFKPYVLACAASKGLKTRVIFWHVAITDVLDGPARRLIYRVLARHRDLLANSHATAAATAFAGHLGRMRVVHLGVPDGCAADGTAPAARGERAALLGIDPGARVIAYTASFVAYKKHQVLLDAFSLLAAEYPDLHLVLIGVGAIRHELQANAPARVHFVGARPDVRRLLGVVDIYAHPAVGEGFGLAAVEAMLACVPVIAARAGALPELVDGTSTGLLCAANDVADLAACLRRLLDNLPLRQQLGAAARETALRYFSPTAYADALTEAVMSFSGKKDVLF